MVVFYFFFEKIASTLFCRQLSGTNLPAHKKLCATWINKSIKMEKGKDGIVMHQHAFY